MASSIWAVVAKTCSECDKIGIAFFDHKPTKEEIYWVEESIGGNWCIYDYVFCGEINGEPTGPIEE